MSNEQRIAELEALLWEARNGIDHSAHQGPNPDPPWCCELEGRIDDALHRHEKPNSHE